MEMKAKPRVKFTPEEDKCLFHLVKSLGSLDWELISQNMKGRTPRQCRDRWNNYLRPTLNNKPYSEEEDKKLMDLFQKFGPKWAKIAVHFHSRSSNSLRNHYNVLEKKLQAQKIEEKIPAPIEKPPEFDVSMSIFDGVIDTSILDPQFFEFNTTL